MRPMSLKFQAIENHPNDSRVKFSENNVIQTLSGQMDTGGGNVPMVLENEYVVRRLTPTECEKLQGLPAGYTDIEFKGKPAPNSRRYKAIGNGMAQPCADFVLRKIAESIDKEKMKI